ncbi:helix-turn-helix domain-containing protein [Paenibacillus soyae]|uniref:Helix-turn-helix domain-containing protein n=1 Tax=Paenibacillus soyae TaxID=2969249 RepID=A0A9X2SAB6_9BACL|nr:helix-turn-helix domain-containing protein [Paenibacillus soyae]MCR2806449.1 helix-turn-helix domain-containing protein [Paenibacillus soyae]
MQRQTLLLTLPHHPYFCLPESVGHYYEWPEHGVTRGAGALNNFSIHYVVSGKGYVESDGIVHKLEAGQAFLYFPLQRQRYYSDKEEPWDIRWIHFYGNVLQDYMLRLELQQSQLWTLRQSDRWMDAHEALLSEAESFRMLRPHRLSALTYELLTIFVEQAAPVRDAKSGSSSHRILELLPKMQREACEPFLLETWAREAGVTPYYFCKLFRSVMEMTPMDFITRCRLQTAKQWLLERQEASIGQIAKEAGYPSASYFNKRFMAHEGMTPTAYRQLYTAAR